MVSKQTVEYSESYSRDSLVLLKTKVCIGFGTDNMNERCLILCLLKLGFHHVKTFHITITTVTVDSASHLAHSFNMVSGWTKNL